MTKPWRIREEAERERDEAADRYERARPGLGFEYLEALRDAVAALRAMPTIGSPVPGAPRDLPVRRVFLRRFPYAVVYLELEAEYVILAVAHLRRRPNYWRRRAPR